MSSLRYNAGQDVQLGDTVRWGDTASSTVVVMITEQNAMTGYDATEWDFLGNGCMLHVPDAALIHYEAEGLDGDANLVLLQRADCPPLL